MPESGGCSTPLLAGTGRATFTASGSGPENPSIVLPRRSDARVATSDPPPMLCTTNGRKPLNQDLSAPLINPPRPAGLPVLGLIRVVRAREEPHLRPLPPLPGEFIRMHLVEPFNEIG